MPDTKSTKSFDPSAINLKKFAYYKALLLIYSRAMGISIEYESLPEGGSWIPSRRKIKIDNELSESEEIATILHELGHIIDDASIHEVGIKRKLDRTYSRVYKHKVTKKQLKTVIACEKRAWSYGRAIAKIIGIPLGKWYDENEKVSIKEYKTNVQTVD